jgi:hypothetical protein
MNMTKAIEKCRLNAMRDIFVMILLMVSLLLTACSENHAKKPKKKNFIQKGNEIHFTLSGESAYVPKAYFRGGSEDQFGILHYVKLWALLPGFEVYDDAKNHNEFYPSRGFGRRIDVKLISRGKRPVKINNMVMNFAENLTNYPVSGKLGQFDEYKYELEIYRSTTNTDDFYLHRENDVTIIYIHCSSKMQAVPYPVCMMLWDISDNIGAEAIFSLDYISEWKSILDKIKGLIHTS